MMRNIIKHGMKKALGGSKGYRDLDYFKKEYGAEITYTDAQIQRLIDVLKHYHIFEDTIFVITSDHGENFGEHEIYFDHWTLYNTDIHVPLIISYPKKLPRGKRIETDVMGIDIAPTILELAGERNNEIARDFFEGRSLCDLWRSPGKWETRILSSSALLLTAAAAWDERYKLIWELRNKPYHEDIRLYTDRVAIYDRENDPEEENPIGVFYWGDTGAREADPWDEEKSDHTIVEKKVLNTVLERAKERISKKQVPSADELRSWFLEKNGRM